MGGGRWEVGGGRWEVGGGRGAPPRDFPFPLWPDRFFYRCHGPGILRCKLVHFQRKLFGT